MFKSVSVLSLEAHTEVSLSEVLDNKTVKDVSLVGDFTSLTVPVVCNIQICT